MVDQSRWPAVAGGETNPGTVFEAAVCLECRETGYLGRAGIYEIMLLTPKLKALVMPEFDVAKLRNAAFAEGMTALRIAGMRKVAQGQTTIDEVLGASPDPQASV